MLQSLRRQLSFKRSKRNQAWDKGVKKAEQRSTRNKAKKGGKTDNTYFFVSCQRALPDLHHFYTDSLIVAEESLPDSPKERAN